jgi:hypothetical protein
VDAQGGGHKDEAHQTVPVRTSSPLGVGTYWETWEGEGTGLYGRRSRVVWEKVPNWLLGVGKGGDGTAPCLVCSAIQLTSTSRGVSCSPSSSGVLWNTRCLESLTMVPTRDVRTLEMQCSKQCSKQTLRIPVVLLRSSSSVLLRPPSKSPGYRARWPSFALGQKSHTVRCRGPEGPVHLVLQYL